MKIACILQLLVGFSCLIHISSGKLHSYDDDGENLVSKKSGSSKNQEKCDTTQEKCAAKEGAPKNMMDGTANALVEMGMKYYKDFADGKLDFTKILSSDYIKQLMNMVMHASLPGGNPTMAAGFQLFQKFTASMVQWEKGLKKDGLNLKEAMDKIHSIINEVVPHLVIAVQHSDRNCRRQALCKAARSSADTRSNLAQSASIFLSHVGATYLDYTEKSKKSEYMKVVQCCMSDDKPIYSKCASPYMDENLCSAEMLADASLLKSIDYSKLQVLKQFLPKFNK